jgi:hypothetical protein
MAKVKVVQSRLGLGAGKAGKAEQKNLYPPKKS